MAKSTPRGNPIEQLLQERAQFTSWLARLDSSGDAVASVPEGVRHRVRGDYEARLHAVIEELRSHVAGIEEQLEEYRARKYELTRREAQAKEMMSEAEVRHAVGEYDEAKWQTIRGDTARVLVSVREELSKTNQEIERLAEVHALIVTPVAEPEPELEPVAPPPTPPPAMQPPRLAEPSRASAEVPLILIEPDLAPPSPMPTPVQAAHPPAHDTPIRTPVGGKPAPKPAPVKPKEDAPARTLWFPSGKPTEASPGGKMDELAFLKSVSSADQPPPKRASGGFKTAEAPASATPSQSGPVVINSDPFSTKGPESAKERGSQTVAPKTLKCGECGTMNRPTEWYCERCGAELAAL